MALLKALTKSIDIQVPNCKKGITLKGIVLLGEEVGEQTVWQLPESGCVQDCPVESEGLRRLTLDPRVAQGENIIEGCEGCSFYTGSQERRAS